MSSVEPSVLIIQPHEDKHTAADNLLQSRKHRSTKLLENIEEKTRTSRRFLEYNKENICELTSRISRAISSLDCTSRRQQHAKQIESLKEKIDRKLKIF